MFGNVKNAKNAHRKKSVERRTHFFLTLRACLCCFFVVPKFFCLGSVSMTRSMSLLMATYLTVATDYSDEACSDIANVSAKLRSINDCQQQSASPFINCYVHRSQFRSNTMKFCTSKRCVSATMPNDLPPELFPSKADTISFQLFG